MQDEGHTRVHVAPLRLGKSQRDLRTDIETAAVAENTVQLSKMLPAEMLSSPRPTRFSNFLRASYPFVPPEQFSSTSVTLPLSAGDLILVHTVHTNGWADGTLLETGARGWMPTNYCEPYDYATMRPLLRALVEFWDIIRSDGDNAVELYRNHDYMRGMVAGVRYLLEKSDCLTRDAAFVKRHDSIRKTRKGLLSDLSLLVKDSKTVQASTQQSGSEEFTRVLDDMLLKAFQVVTRAVSFFDIWSEEVVPRRSPRVVSFSPEYISSSDASIAYDSVGGGISKRTSVYGPQSPISLSGPGININTRARPASITRPPTLTHRMTRTVRGMQAYNDSLASEQLSDTYDAFLGVLASFLGSHMQSRSSSELLLTTQQAVKSCRKLLEIVEIILEHDMAAADGLQQAKDVMYDKITELVHAAREVFRPLHTEDEDMIYLPSEGARLVNAATACVSGAGRCVARARALLEEIGDFELELRTDYSEVSSPTQGTFNTSFMVQDSTSTRRNPPNSRLDIIQELARRQSRRDSNLVISTPTASSFWTPVTETNASPTPSSPSSAEVRPVDTASQAQQQRSLALAALRGSEDTLVSSPRDSGPSFVSQASTRATSPDSQSISTPGPHDDERDDGEDALMEHYFAHELVFNQEGRIVGGSLNAVIERLTSHEAKPDSSFVTMVFLTFRLFATPPEFAQALAYRFDYIGQSPRIAQLVRLRVCNVFKGWLESYWRHDCDESSLRFISNFVEGKTVLVSTTVGTRLMELVNTVAKTRNPAVPRVLSSMGKANAVASSYQDLGHSAPTTILSKSQLNALRTWKMGGSALSVLDFDPLELARQLTIKTSAIFCSILPEELLGCEFMKQSSSLAVNVRALSALSNDLGNLVIDSILLDVEKKRAAVIKQWIKIAARCLELHNYETLMTINASLNASSVLRLEHTWSLIGQKTKNTFEEMKKAVDHAKNYAGLRERLQTLHPPCIPYVGIIRTDLTFVDQGCQPTRELKSGEETSSVINLDKHIKTAKIISDLQRFQVSYKLTSVDELQTWLQNECVRVRAAGERSFQNQYRRSLILEPKTDSREMMQKPKLTAFPSMTQFTGKEKYDWLAWTSTHKERNGSISSS